MVWSAIIYKRKINLVGIEACMDSQHYTDIYGNSLIHTVDKLLDEDWAFQHVNAAVHSSTLTKHFLEANEVEVLDCTATSPEINIIGNVWCHTV